MDWWNYHKLKSPSNDHQTTECWRTKKNPVLGLTEQRCCLRGRTSFEPKHYLHDEILAFFMAGFTWFFQITIKDKWTNYFFIWGYLKSFPGRVLSGFDYENKPPRSSDLTSLDFFLWGYLKWKVYANKPTTCTQTNLYKMVIEISMKENAHDSKVKNWQTACNNYDLWNNIIFFYKTTPD